MERAGSTGLALSGLIGLLFLTVLVWQIAKPTFIDGESGQIEPASEFIPVSDYILKWDHPTVDDNGDLIGDAVVLELSWNDGSPQTHEITITVRDAVSKKTSLWTRPVYQPMQWKSEEDQILPSFEPGRPRHR